MKLVTKLKIFGIFASCLAVILGCTAYWRFLQVDIALERNKIATAMVRQAFVFTVLNDDYLRTRGERARTQWQLQHDHFNQNLSSYHVETEEERDIIGELKQKQQTVNEHFALLQAAIDLHIASASAAPMITDTENRLTNQLAIDMQEIVTLASDLANSNSARLDAVRQSTSVILFFVISVLGVSLAYTYFVFARSITKGIRKLTEGTEILGRGNLDFRFQVDTTDELGDYAHSFNEMTSQLSSLYAKIEAERVELEKFGQAVESATDGIIMTDTKGTIQYVNRAWEHLTGYNRNEAIGKNPRILHSDKTPPDEYRRMWQTLIQGDVFQTEAIINKRKDGSEYEAQLQVFPIIDKGTTLFYVGIEQDISKRKELDRAKDEFITLASHELRAPITAVKWRVAMLLSGDYGTLAEQVKQALTKIAMSVEDQIHLVGDLLNVCRLETNKIVYTVTTFSLHEVVKDAVDSLAITIAEKPVSITVEQRSDLHVVADRHWATQILINVIDNALKFTPKGSITICYRREDRRILVVIADTGVGIPQSEHHKLFKKFQQIHVKVLNKPPGLGLGLYISREVAIHMGGDIWLAQSAPGRGSTFVVALPVAESYATGKELKSQQDESVAETPEQTMED